MNSTITNAQEPTVSSKRALIIAIGRYPAEMGYPPIHVDRDVVLMRATLASQGFDSALVRVVRDADATREGILAALDQLVEQARAGDAVVVHYSGHGHRISDDNGDELDGFDEILVPYGAPADVRAAGYRGERHIRDEEFGRRLSALQHALGATGSLTVLVDACFSGSATRGGPEEAVARGVAEPIIVPGARPAARGGADAASGLLDRSASQRGAAEGGGVSGAAPLVVISAARHDQVAREAYDEQRNPVGSLSLAASRILSRLAAQATYREVFDRIAAEMAGMNLGDQVPQVEGDIDARVFSGHVVEQAQFLRVTEIRRDSRIEVAGGTLVAVLPGTRIAFHRRGTANPRTVIPIATGTVSESTVNRAIVNLDGATNEAALVESWAFVTEYAYGDLAIRIAIDSTLDQSAAPLVRDVLSSVGVIALTDDRPDLRVRPERRAGAVTGVALHAAADGKRIAGPFALTSPSWSDDLRDAARAVARSTYLRRLQLSSPGLRVRLEVVRTEARINWSTGEPVCREVPPSPIVTPPSTEGITMSPRDEYTLRLVNEGTEAAYVVVLDLLPDGTSSQLFPRPQALGSDNYLAAGKSFLIPDVCFYAEEPYGTELLKLFATKERVDFTTVLSGAQGSTRSFPNPLERFFEELYSGTRSGAVAPAGAASTHDVTINVVPRRPAIRPGR